MANARESQLDLSFAPPDGLEPATKRSMPSFISLIEDALPLPRFVLIRRNARREQFYHGPHLPEMNIAGITDLKRSAGNWYNQAGRFPLGLDYREYRVAGARSSKK